MQDIFLDRDHYLALAQKEGLWKAITELHHEMKELEHRCFEGAEGYRPDIYEKLKDYRTFSRELWLLNVETALDVSHEDILAKRKF